MPDNNKVKFGLKNVHYAIATIDGANVSFGTPVPIPGAVSLSLDPEGDRNVFYADDSEYYVTDRDNGYSGDLEVAKFPDEFFIDVFHMFRDANGALVEDANASYEHFALLFEFKGDKNRTRHIFYNCTCSRPAVASQTTEDTIEPVTETTTITATPLPENASGQAIVKLRVTPADLGYEDFYEAVLEFLPDTLTMAASASVTVEGTASVAATSNALGAVLRYESSDTSVATVSDAGLVTGVAAGTAVITARSSAGGFASCAVEVTTE